MKLLKLSLILLLLSAVPVSAQNNLANGTIDEGTDNVSFTVPIGTVSMNFEVSGTFVGTLEIATSTVEASTPTNIQWVYDGSVATLVENFDSPGSYSLTNTGFLRVQIRPVGASWTSGAANIRVLRGYGPIPAAGSGGGSEVANVTPAQNLTPGAIPPVVAYIHCADQASGITFSPCFEPSIISRSCYVADADGAQTNAACVTVAAGTLIIVRRVAVTCDADNTDDISITVGLGTASVPTRALAGAAKILLDHPGVPAGGGQDSGPAVGILQIGASDEDVRFTMADPVGGACVVTVAYNTAVSS